MGNTQNGNPGGRAATRAVALVGPAGTGKTSLAEALLFASGAITRQDSVEGGNSVGDASAEARARGSSTEINLSRFEYLGDRFALIDASGGTGFDARVGGGGGIDYPARNAALAIRTRDRKDDVKLSTALHRLCEEDPALEWTQDDAAHETVLRGINDDHLAVVIGRLQRRYGVAVDTRPPRIAYRKSIRKTATQRGRHKKQSGGHGQYGDCVIEVRPLPRGEGFRFVDKITGGVIPRQWIPAVELGVRDAMERGPLGFPVVDVEVTLIDGSFHAVDSSELAFRIAGRIAMSQGLASFTAGFDHLTELAGKHADEVVRTRAAETA